MVVTDRNTQFIVAQLGARMHYAIPRMLYGAGRLKHFFTDLCGVKGWPRFLRPIPRYLLPKCVKPLTARVPDGVPPERITAFTRFGWQYALRRRRARTPAEVTEAHVWAGRTFSKLVLASGVNGAGGVYTFDGAGLELLRYARRHGLRAVMEQTIAPRRVLRQLIAEERELHPEWEGRQRSVPLADELERREEDEWQVADTILCGSEFVRQGIRDCGGPVDRYVVVPYGVDSRFEITKQPSRNGPLRVLTVGTVGLRKGSPYVLAASRLLRGKAHFRLAGSMNVLPDTLRKLSAYVDLLGPVPRFEILAHYAWADVFLLPSLCEGSATACYEALACGLPVIATPNTGSVVRDGVEGFLVPIRAPERIAECLERLAADPDLRAEMARNARQRSQEFTIEGYRARLVKALRLE